jgi:hypothetical protein
MKVIMEIVCERVYSGISETNNIAALATRNAGINEHGHKREKPRLSAGFRSEAFEEGTQRVPVSLPFTDHFLDIRHQRRRRRK